MTAEMIHEMNSQVFGVWFLIGAALVFWMQAGFAMVETGFTRAKNSGNILMKNLMDFCIGCPMFILIGFSLLMGEDLWGWIGKPGFDIFTHYAEFDWSGFVFNLVFCATTATIVSGAMAERTKFLSYCVYSAVISAVIYPIEAHWIWGGGWLAQIGFHDYAGSTAIHMVGGICALIGAAIVGPRLGKFVKDSSGNIRKVNAFPGHNLPLGCLGVFILWLGWYGFNGAAATTVDEMASIFVTTTIAPSIATVVCMIFTWLKYGKPDVSMCLNASLAGLVGITAPCDVTDAFGAVAIGAVAGVLVVFGVWLLDHVLYIDDPVGAVAVHCMNGIWGTIAVGLFATDASPAFVTAGIEKGLFYGGGFRQLWLQLIGVVSVAAWAAVLIWITFSVIKAVFGLRVTEEEEILGLDITEHGLAGSYADFMPVTQMAAGEEMIPYVQAMAPGTGIAVSAAGAVTGTASAGMDGPAVSAETGGIRRGPKMTKVDIVMNSSKLEALRSAMLRIGVTGMTVTNVLGCGLQKGHKRYYRGIEMESQLLPKTQVEIVISKIPVRTVVETAKKVLYTGQIGDGKIFIYDVENVVKIRTGEEGYDALQDEA